MYFLAGVAFAFSGALVAFAGRGDRESLAWLTTILASYSIVVAATTAELEQNRSKYDIYL